MDINKLGFGVMISMLSSNADSVQAYKRANGKIITQITLEDEEKNLVLTFSDGSTLTFFDDGQSCYESRYMKVDDDLSTFIGASFVCAEIKDAPNMRTEYGEHEVQFLEIITSRGVLNISAHNEHNGYYGGFSLRCK